MLEKKYYDGIQIHRIISEEVKDNDTIMKILKRFADEPSALGTNLAEVGTDCISRQAAIDAIGEVHPLDYNAQAIKSRIERLPSAQPDTVKDLVTIFQNSKDMKLIARDGDLRADRIVLGRMPFEWIPCSERLPEDEHKTYWVCTDTGYQCECRWTNVNPIWTDLTTDWHWNIFDTPQYTKVVAWMTLPEPYEEK